MREGITVPQMKSEKPFRPEALDRKHAATQKQIEQLPASMTQDLQ
jgi:hypothetical protein